MEEIPFSSKVAADSSPPLPSGNFVSSAKEKDAPLLREMLPACGRAVGELLFDL